MGCRLLQCMGRAAENKLDVTTDKSKDDAAVCPAMTFTRIKGRCNLLRHCGSASSYSLSSRSGLSSPRRPFRCRRGMMCLPVMMSTTKEAMGSPSWSTAICE